jgi:hypothetical protein
MRDFFCFFWSLLVSDGHPKKLQVGDRMLSNVLQNTKNEPYLFCRVPLVVSLSPRCKRSSSLSVQDTHFPDHELSLLISSAVRGSD